MWFHVSIMAGSAVSDFIARKKKDAHLERHCWYTSGAENDEQVKNLCTLDGLVFECCVGWVVSAGSKTKSVLLEHAKEVQKIVQQIYRGST